MALSEKIRAAVRKYAVDERQVDEISSSVENAILGELDELSGKFGAVRVGTRYPDE